MRLNRYAFAAAAAALLAASPALAQSAPTPAAKPAPAAAAAPAAPAASGDAAKQTPTVPEAVKAWAKFCDPQPNGHTVCIVRKLAFQNTTIMGSLVLRIDQGKGVPTLAVAAVPVGVVLKPGLKWQVDSNKPVVLPFWRCTPQTCESETVVNAALITQLRKGNTLSLTAKNVEGKDFVVKISLNGFADAYDKKNAPTFAEYSKSLGQAETTGLKSGQ